jgi:DNA modification methylase
MLELNKIYCMDNVAGMSLLDDDCIDMVLCSPPYSDLRQYHNYSWDFDSLAKVMLQKLKPGGVVVWVVGDKTVKGCEELVPFTQALRFKELGFNVWDTMLYQRESPFPALVRYKQDFEFVFILSKGKVKTFNPLRIPRDYPKSSRSYRHRNTDGSLTTKLDSKSANRLKADKLVLDKPRGCIWKYGIGYMKTTKDKEAYEHPAMFPEQLATDHILSWSNEGDIVCDPFSGSATTAKMSLLNGRNYIGFDVSQEYCDLAERRLAKYKEQLKLDV